MSPIPYQRPRTFVQAAFWIYPTWQVSVASGHERPVAWVLCLVAGSLWQLVFRRDLVDRLTTVAVFLAVGVVLAAVVEVALAGTVSFESGKAAAVLSCLAGLVLTEQALRLRELRRAQRRRVAPSPREGVGAGS